MKAFVAVLFALLLLTQLGSAQAPQPTAAQLVGTWQLVSVTDTIDGKDQVSPSFGVHPIGFLMYEPDGHMCATLTSANRPAWKDPAKATDAEKIAYYDSFYAYCGTYKLDAANSTVYHYPTIAWIPAYIGSTQKRPFRLEGDKLIITTTQNTDPRLQKRVLVWQRAKAASTEK